MKLFKGDRKSDYLKSTWKNILSVLPVYAQVLTSWRSENKKERKK